MRIWGTHAAGVDMPRADGAWGRARLLVPFHALVAVVLTWPLAFHATGWLNQGTEPAPTVPLFNLWTLRWNQDRAGHLFAGYWDAPIFHPAGGTFAFSEPQPLTGLAFSPLSWLTGNPVLAANLVALAILTANGWAAGRLARHLGAAPLPATLLGVLAQGMPFVATEMGVLQLTVVFPLFLLLDATVRWARQGGRPTAAEMGLWLGATFLTCGYYGLFAVVGIGPPALLLARRDWLSRARLGDLAAAAGLGAVLTLPVAITQARITADHPRPDELVRALSATPADFGRLDAHAHGAGVLPWVGEQDAGFALYPGTVLLVLGAAGLALALAGRPRGQGTPTEERDAARFFAAGASLGALLALGRTLSIAGWEPYGVLQDAVPGLAALRSPFRFAVLVQVFLVALAARGLDAVWRWRPRTGGRGGWGPVAAVTLVVAGIGEAGTIPVDRLEVERDTAGWVRWLGEHAAPTDDRAPRGPGHGAGDGAGKVAGDGAVAFLPFPAGNDVASYEHTTRRMLQALDAGVATVNGYSGLFPGDYERLEIAMRAYPNFEADALLRQSGVSYLVVEPGWLDDPVNESWIAARYRRVFEDRDAVLFEVP